MIPKQTIIAASEAMREVTPPPGVSKADWLAEHGSFALIAGAIAAAHPVLLADLRKAHEALERVEALHKESAHGGCEECERVVEESISGDGQYRMSNWPCPTVEAVRAAVAAAKGDE